MKDFFELLECAEFWIGFIIFTLIVSGSTTIVLNWKNENAKEIEFMHQGYEQVILPGSFRPVWQKVKGDNNESN